MKNNNKGFTLVELLAVIIILAVVVLMALPAVLGLMESSRQNAFKTEVNELVKIVQNAYSRKSLSGEDIETITPTDGKSFRYMCMTLADLTNENYTEKPYNDPDSIYQGYYEVFVPIDGTGTVYRIHYYNGTYTADGLLYSYTASEAYAPSYSEPGNDFNTCPATKPTAIPTS